MTGAAIPVGTTIAGYRIDASVGRGGMGSVFRATQLKLGRPVALKLIVPELAEDAGYRERFRREATLAASLDHPNVVPVYEADEADGCLYMSMRFVDGEDLATLVARDCPLDVGLAVRLAAQVASALDAAHERGLVHRDVKPRNVLVSGKPGEEHAYLTDFGVAKDIAHGSDLTRTGQVVGTLAYAAPEQLRGAAVDGRADIYALGCMLYESLTGLPPFARDSDSATVAAQLLDPPPSVRASRPDVTVELDEVVERAMAKSPDARYSSAADFGRAALAALDGRRVADSDAELATRAVAVPLAISPPARTRPSRAARRAAVGLLVAVVVGATIVAISSGGEDPSIAPSGGAKAGRVVATVAVGREPKAVAALADVVLVANEEGGGEIRRIDPRTNRVAGAPVKLAIALNGLGVAGGRAWALSNGRIYPTDETGKLGPPIKVGGESDVVWAVAGDRTQLWVATSTLEAPGAAGPLKRARSSVVRVDLRTRRASAPVKIAGTGDSSFVSIAARDNTAWAAQHGERRLSIVTRGSSGLTTTSVPLPDRPSGVAVDLDKVWVTLGPSTDVRYANTVIRLDPRTREILDPPTPVLRQPTRPIIDNGSLWLLSPIDGAVGRLSTDTQRVIGTPVRVAREPSDMSAGGGAVWISDRKRDVVTRVEP